MKQLILLISTILLTNWPARPHHPATYGRPRHTPAAATVLICESRRAYAYHSYECHGLKRCQSAVSRMNLSDARAMGYAPCKICY